MLIQLSDRSVVFVMATRYQRGEDPEDRVRRALESHGFKRGDYVTLNPREYVPAYQEAWDHLKGFMSSNDIGFAINDTSKAIFSAFKFTSDGSRSDEHLRVFRVLRISKKKLEELSHGASRRVTEGSQAQTKEQQEREDPSPRSA